MVEKHQIHPKTKPIYVRLRIKTEWAKTNGTHHSFAFIYLFTQSYENKYAFMPIESGRIQFRKSCVSEINRFKRVNRTGFFSFYCMCAMLCLPFGHAARYHHYKLSGKRHKFYFMTTNRRSKFYLYALVCVCVCLFGFSFLLFAGCSAFICLLHGVAFISLILHVLGWKWC